MKRLAIMIGLTLVLTACKKAETTKLPPATYSISGKLSTPQGPVSGAGVILVSYTDETCAKLEDKSNKTEEEKKAPQCWKKAGEVKTDETGEYEFPDVKAGWYKILMGWQVELKSELISGADLTGEYRTYYARTEKDQKKFGIGVVGHPFLFTATQNLTKDYLYNRDPYKTAKP